MDKLTLQKIKEKKESLEEYSNYLLTLQKETVGKSAFLSNFRLFGNTERYLQLSIQCILDINMLIITGKGLEKPHDNYEALSILKNRSILSEESEQQLKKMVGLRNILVHEYGRIDKEMVYDMLQNRLGDIENYKKEISKYLKTISH